MTRNALLAAAFAASSLFATAANAERYYTATPAAAPAKPSLIAGSMLWKCDGGTCTAGKTSSRDAIVCQHVVKRAGKLDAFTAGTTSFDEAALAKCNERAK